MFINSRAIYPHLPKNPRGVSKPSINMLHCTKTHSGKLRTLVSRERSWFSSCATMPGPKPWPVICFTSVHIWQRSLVSCATMPGREPWLVICSTSVSLVPAQIQLGEPTCYVPFLFHDRCILFHKFHDRSKRHVTSWQSLPPFSMLQPNWNAHSFGFAAIIHRCFFDLST